ncbi:unnamed protein product [Protopolystoma xenopodis]|uniref:Uncharacterized protein n=1 Tax=Protopolystoma xenopodis TaxID=117903 RepID=A0A3S5A222_9PLAT|nr:unnamed protein product [Protopolystoma xenopodis]
MPAFTNRQQLRFFFRIGNNVRPGSGMGLNMFREISCNRQLVAVQRVVFPVSSSSVSFQQKSVTFEWPWRDTSGPGLAHRPFFGIIVCFIRDLDLFSGYRY